MIVERLVVGPLEANCWIVGAEPDGPVVVVDPGADAQNIIAAVGERVVEAIVLTHAHFDHVGAASRVREQWGCPVIIHENDAARLTSDGMEGTGAAPFGFEGHVPEGADKRVAGGDSLELAGLTFRVIHTPGHTGGGICLLVENPDGQPLHLFSGDTLFASGVGRSDLPGGDGRALSRSIASELAPLPPETLVHPGHGPDTTIGTEVRINPYWPRG